MALGLVVEIRLLEHEGHPEHALPEVDRRLPVGTRDRDVVDALALELPHRANHLASVDALFRARRASTCIRCAADCPTAPARRGPARPARRARALPISPASDGSASEPAASSTATGSGGSCLAPGLGGPHQDVAAHARHERAHDLADGRGKDVDAAHDEHVVGAPDAAHARARAAAGARAGAHEHVIAGAEAQQRRGAVAEMREHELAASRRPRARAPPPSRARSARRARSRARRGACRPGGRIRPTATGRCRRCPWPR